MNPGRGGGKGRAEMDDCYKIEDDMLEHLTTRPQEPIMRLFSEYHQDRRKEKINLALGIYTDENGKPTILDVVKQAEYHRYRNETSKASMSITGLADYHDAVRKILFPAGHPLAHDERVRIIQTVGASGAIYLALKLCYQDAPRRTVWLSDPTWQNYFEIVREAGLGQQSYGYCACAAGTFSIDLMMKDLATAMPGDVIILQGCCHNPTGLDPT